MASELQGSDDFPQRNEIVEPLPQDYFSQPIHITNKPSFKRDVEYSRVHEFLSINGPLIKSIYLSYICEKGIEPNGDHGDQDIVNDVLNTIADLCGNTLIELHITSYYHINLNSLSQFKALQKLDVLDAMICNLGSNTELKTLRFETCKFADNSWCTNAFPKLEEVIFLRIKKVTNDMFIEFQKHKTELKSIIFDHFGDSTETEKLTSSIFREINSRVPNLTKLEFKFSRTYLPEMKLEDILHLCNLQKLKRLTLSCDRSQLGKALIDGFAENNIPIDFLDFYGVLDNTDYLESLPKLMISELSLHGIPVDEVIKCIKGLPSLKKLKLYQVYDNVPNLCFIKQILECGTNLNYLSVGLKNVTVDLEDYNSLVAIAKHKAAYVRISLFDSILNVDENILLAKPRIVSIWANSCIQKNSDANQYTSIFKTIY